MADNPYTNKVVFGDETLIDLTNDTVSAESLAEGETAHDASGNTVVGTASVTTKPTVDDSGKVWTAGPDCTASWQQVESSSDILLVRITDNKDGSYSADKTYNEILEAYSSGKIPILLTEYGEYIPFSKIGNSNSFKFEKTWSESNPDGSKLIKSGTYVISSDNTVTYYETDYTNNLLPDSTEDDNNKILSVVGGIPTWKEADSLSITSSDDGAGNVTITIA